MDIVTLTDEQVYDIARPIWNTMRKGSNHIDYELFSRSFCTELKQKIDQQRFENQCREWPLLTSLGSATPIACIRRMEGITVLFKQLSTQLDGEFLGQLTLSGSGKPYAVINAQVY